MHPSEYDEGGEAMREEFRAFLILLLDMLESGETARAIAAFGDESYSREELVAEISAATILSTLGLESGNSFRNSAAYVQHWSEHIAKDPMMFVAAAGRAEKAVALILGQAAA